MRLLARELAKKLADREAAIRRVRHLADTGSIAAPDLTDHDRGWNAALTALRDALGATGEILDDLKGDNDGI